MLAHRAQDYATALVQDLENDSACPMRKDKARRFEELMRQSEVKGGSCATYLRMRDKLEKQGKLTVEPVQPIRLLRNHPPEVRSQAEVDLIASPPQQQEGPGGPPDLPPHDTFTRPIPGNAGLAQQPPPQIAVDGAAAMKKLPDDLNSHREDDCAA
jgi:hypothetical protein